MIPKRGSAAETLRARGLRLTEPRRLILDVVRAVHFVRFALPDAARRTFLASEVALVVDHPNERARTVPSPATKASLARDLA